MFGIGPVHEGQARSSQMSFEMMQSVRREGGQQAEVLQICYGCSDALQRLCELRSCA